MSNAEELRQKVAWIFTQGLNLEVPSEDTHLIESGLLDSLTLVGLLFQIEQVFSITIPIEELDLERWKTVRSIAEVVQARLARRAGTLLESGAPPSPGPGDLVGRRER